MEKYKYVILTQEDVNSAIQEFLRVRGTWKGAGIYIFTMMKVAITGTIQRT